MLSENVLSFIPHEPCFLNGTVGRVRTKIRKQYGLSGNAGRGYILSHSIGLGLENPKIIKPQIFSKLGFQKFSWIKKRFESEVKKFWVRKKLRTLKNF